MITEYTFAVFRVPVKLVRNHHEDVLSRTMVLKVLGDSSTVPGSKW